LKRKFRERDDGTMKIVKLKFIQDFQRVAKKSKYKKRPLVKEFKREMNRVIRKKLMKLEYLLTSIEQ